MLPMIMAETGSSWDQETVERDCGAVRWRPVAAPGPDARPACLFAVFPRPLPLCRRGSLMDARRGSVLVVAAAAACLIHAAQAQDEHEHASPPGCGATPILQGATGCGADCAGLAYVASMGVCRGCSLDGVTPITAENVQQLDPPAVLCPPAHAQADCPSGYALCPATTVTCTGTPEHAVGSPSCEGTTSDGSDCQLVFEHARRQDSSTCPDECTYTNEFPTCTTGWLDDLLWQGDLQQHRPFRVCDRDPDDLDLTPEHGCAESCAPGCDLRWDAPALGPVGICVPVAATPAEATCVPAEDGADCSAFTPQGGADTCGHGCTYTGPPCQSCPGFASATVYDNDNDSRRLVCAHAATCGDTDGDLSNGVQPFAAGPIGCGAGQPREDTAVGCGDEGCDRETCCELHANMAEAVTANCPDLTDAFNAVLPGSTGEYISSIVESLALEDVTEWMQAPGGSEVQGLLLCLMAPADRGRLCESSGMGGFQRTVLQDFCSDEITAGQVNCPSEEHHHCCSCFSDDYPLSPDDGHCCGDCGNICFSAESSLPEGDVCAGVSGVCDPMLFMGMLQDLLKVEETGTAASEAVYASALSMLAPEKVGVFCACRAVGTKMILQGGPDRNEAEAVEGDSCLPEEHPAGADSLPAEYGPCTSGVHINLDGDRTYAITRLDGYEPGPDECRWSITCPAGSTPAVSFSSFMLDSYSLGQIAETGDLAAELAMTGECSGASAGILDFNNPVLYGADSRDDLPVIAWEVAASTPSATRAGEDVTAVRISTTWEHIVYEQFDWENAGICGTEHVGDLSAPAVHCQIMVGTYDTCVEACSSNPDCMAFSRSAEVPDDSSEQCSLIKDATDTQLFPHDSTTPFVTYAKQRTVLVPGVWTRDPEKPDEWTHENGCHELKFEDDGFELETECINGEDLPNLDSRDAGGNAPGGSGRYELDFKSDLFHCAPFEGRGDYIRCAPASCPTHTYFRLRVANPTGARV